MQVGKKGQVSWMMAHLGDVLIALLVLVVSLLIAYSLHDESMYGFDKFQEFLVESSEGEHERERAHIVILDHPSAIVFFEDSSKNLDMKYLKYESAKYLNYDDVAEDDCWDDVGNWKWLSLGATWLACSFASNNGILVKIAVPSTCEDNCLCYMKDFDVSKSGEDIMLSDDNARCFNDLGFHVEYSGVYGDKQIYEFSNGWAIERGLARLATREYVYDLDYDEENQKGIAINNQILSRRRTVYVSSDENDRTVYVYQYHKRFDDGDYTDQTLQTTEMDYIPGEMGGTDHDKQMAQFDDRN